MVLAGFVRGQLSVCVILGVFYAAALWAIGLQFGFLVGLIAGLISFIPYVGSMVGLVLSVGIALFQFWDAKLWIFVTAGIFLFGQFVEGNILAPNLIGKSVGLHPVWLILALAVFGSLFGFAGLLVAVPVAAALGVVGRFLVDQYLASPMYTGRRRRERLSALSRAAAARPRPADAAGARARRLLRRAGEPARARARRQLARLARRAARGDRAGGVGQDPPRPCLGGADRGARSSRRATSPGSTSRPCPGDAAVAVEDVDRLAARARRAAAEEALFHLCNHLAAGGGSLMVSGRRAPARWTIRLPDLASRLGAATVAQLEPPDDALLAAVLVKLFADRQLAVAPGLIRYLVPDERSFAAAEAVVARSTGPGLPGAGRSPPRLAAEVLQAERQR